MYNFCDFKALDEDNNLITNGEMNGATGWNTTDIAPIGTNDNLWNNAGTFFQTSAFTGDWTYGLSQEVKLKKGVRYLIKTTITNAQSANSTFYIIGIRGDEYDTIITDVLSLENAKFDIEYVPEYDIDKVMIIANNTGESVIFNSSIGYLLIYEIETLFPGDCDYALPMVKGDTIRAYTNFDIDDSINVADLKLGLYSDDALYLPDIATLEIDGDKVFFSWTVPVLPKGNFRFVLYTDSLGYTHMSNVFRYTSNTRHTSVIKYRNTKNILGYDYENEPTYYNQFRIDLWRGLPNWPEKSRGYETYEGDFIRTKSDIQKQREFKLSFASEGIHEAFISALLHDEFYIDDIEFKKSDGENFAIDWSQDEIRIGTGTINLQEVSYSKSIESC